MLASLLAVTGISLPVYAILILGLFSPILPLGIGANVVYHSHRAIKVLWTYLVVDTLVSLLMFYLSQRSLYNHWVIQHFSPVTFALLLWFFYELQTKKGIRRAILGAGAGYFLFWAFIAVRSDTATAAIAFTRPVESFFLLAGSGVCLYAMNKDINRSPFDVAMFWILSGTFVFELGSSVYKILFDYLLRTSPETLIHLIAIYAVLVIFKNIVYSIGFLWLHNRWEIAPLPSVEISRL